MIKISFIIPVYNVKDYIEQCVESIACQASDEIQIVLVDDGSTDCSSAMCDEIAEKYSFVNVFHQKNAGHSAARNFGLSKATGKYVVFVDSDDFIGENCVRRIIDWIDNNDEDLCFMNVFKYFSDGKKQILDVLPERSLIKGKLGAMALKSIAACEKFPGSACGKMFKRSFLIDNGICFPLGLLHGEDLSFMIKCYAYAKDFDYIDLEYYYYRQGREGSVTSCGDKTRIYIDLSRFVINTVNFSEGFQDRKESLYRFAAYEYMITLSTYSLLTKEYVDEANKFFKGYKWMLKYGTSKKMRLLHILVSIFGIRITSTLMRMWLTIR